MNFKDLQSGTTVMKLSNYLEETVSFNNKDARLGKKHVQTSFRQE
jgi:hypothetical protein